jgi:hypothetical protein
MSTLNIKDLHASATLDKGDLAKVRGGYAVTLPGWPMAGYGQEFSLDASQVLGQSQNVANNNGNNAAFVCGITSTVNPTQTGSNNISL